MRKLGMNCGSFPGINAFDSIPYIKNAGFDSIITGFGSDEAVGNIAESAAKYGLAYETVHAPFKGINNIWFPGEDGEIMLKTFLDCVDACAHHNVPVVIIHLSSGVKAPAISEIGTERFDRLVDHAGEKGITIAFENQRKMANLAHVFERYDERENVGFCWDNGHEACFTHGWEYMPIWGHKTVALHIHDNFKEYNKDIHLLPFDGIFDFHKFGEYIRKYNFEGTLMLEALPKNSDFYNDFTAEQFYAEAFKRVSRLRKIVDGE